MKYDLRTISWEMIPFMLSPPQTEADYLKRELLRRRLLIWQFVALIWIVLVVVLIILLVFSGKREEEFLRHGAASQHTLSFTSPLRVSVEQTSPVMVEGSVVVRSQESEE